MKKRLTVFISFLVAASVLFASTGVVIASHVCHESKKTGVTFYESHGCCSKPGNNCESIPAIPSQLKKNCCELSISYHKLDISSLEKTAVATSINSFPAEFILFGNSPLSSIEAHPATPGSYAGIQKLKPGTRNFLFSIHTLLI